MKNRGNFQSLKVPKCEIRDGSDFHDFYTIKSFWVCDFRAKILTFILILVGATPHLISYAHEPLNIYFKAKLILNPKSPPPTTPHP